VSIQALSSIPMMSLNISSIQPIPLSRWPKMHPWSYGQRIASQNAIMAKTCTSSVQIPVHAGTFGRTNCLAWIWACSGAYGGIYMPRVNTNSHLLTIVLAYKQSTTITWRSLEPPIKTLSVYSILLLLDQSFAPTHAWRHKEPKNTFGTHNWKAMAPKCKAVDNACSKTLQPCPTQEASTEETTRNDLMTTRENTAIKIKTLQRLESWQNLVGLWDICFGSTGVAMIVEAFPMHASGWIRLLSCKCGWVFAHGL